MANRPINVVVQGGQYNEDTFDIGDVKWSARRMPPNGWLLADGSAKSRTTYADLFAAIVPLLGGFTVTIASPGVFTLTSHGLVVGDKVYFETSGALPTGLSVDTIYYVVAVPTANTFEVSATRGGSAINTSGSQSGTHNCWLCPFGLGDGSTTFNIPDGLGRVPVGAAGAGAKAEVAAVGANEGLAASLRNISHHHSYTAAAASLFPSGSGSAATTAPGTLTSGDSDNADGPARIVLNMFVKYA